MKNNSPSMKECNCNKTKKTNHTLRIDFEILSNMKRIFELSECLCIGMHAYTFIRLKRRKTNHAPRID